MYECWNPRCSHYAGGGGTVSSDEVFEFQDEKRCDTCGRAVMLSRGCSRYFWVLPMIIGIVSGLVIVVFAR